MNDNQLLDVRKVYLNSIEREVQRNLYFGVLFFLGEYKK